MVGRSARLVWGGITLLLLVLLVGSFFLSRDSIEQAEEDAERLAEALATSTLFDPLTPEMVEADIVGSDYRSLITTVQAKILSDDRIAQVRIWKTDGDLIFSTAQRDEVTEFVAVDNPQIERAAAGEVVSLVTNTTVAARAGLAGSDEQLFETFLPLRLANEASVSAVVQIDQRYSEIRAEALAVWRPMQITVAVLLPASLFLLVLSIRRREEVAEAPVSVPARESRVDERALRDAEERALAAERAARDAEHRLGEIEERLREANEAEVTPSMLGKVEELELKLRASEAEREQHQGEVEGLRAALTERETELTSLREAKPGKREMARAEKVIAEAERVVKESETKAAESAARVAELEARLRVAETAAAEGAGSKDELRARIAELEMTLAGARATILSKDKEIAVKEQELSVANERVAKESAAIEERVVAAELKAADTQERLVDLQSRLGEAESRRTEIERRLAEIEAHAAKAEERAKAAEQAEAALQAELELATAGGKPGKGPSASELEARVAELESARRSDIADLQRAQESLANTQVELAKANRKLKEVGVRGTDLEREAAGVRPPEPTPAPVPVPDYVTRQPEYASAEAEYAAGQEDAGYEPPLEISSFAARLSSLRQEIAAATQPAPEPDSEDEPEEEEVLSLRERLARAAAARHRGRIS